MKRPPPPPPLCERCSQPAYNIDRHGEHTGVHTSIEECFREMGKRLATLESKVKDGEGNR